MIVQFLIMREIKLLMNLCLKIKTGERIFLNLPIKAMVAKIKEHQIPAAVSNTAGTFVCNHVTYGVRHLIETKYQGKRSGFIHIPFLPQQVVDKKNMPSNVFRYNC